MKERIQSKKLTQIISIVAVICLACTLFLVGCGKTEEKVLETDTVTEEESATEEETAEPSATDMIENAQVGDIVNFGEIAFTGYRGNDFAKDVNWRVLAVEGDRVLVISEEIVDLRPYSHGDVETAWEQCDLRAWLNDDFYNGLPIIMKHILAGTADGEDLVFLLSVDEASMYFQSDSDRMAHLSIFEELELENFYGDDDYWYWWLRSPGESAYFAACVGYDGSVEPGGNQVNADNGGVRPAIWLAR